MFQLSVTAKPFPENLLEHIETNYRQLLNIPVTCENQAKLTQLFYRAICLYADLACETDKLEKYKQMAESLFVKLQGICTSVLSQTSVSDYLANAKAVLRSMAPEDNHHLYTNFVTKRENSSLNANSHKQTRETAPLLGY